MIFETLIYSQLSANAGVSALVGFRIYPLVMPQTPTLPALVYTTVSGDPINSLRGFSGTTNLRIQLDCWAKTYAETKSLAAAVHAAMDAPNFDFNAIMLGTRDDYEPDTKLYRVIQDYSVWPRDNH